MRSVLVLVLVLDLPACERDHHDAPPSPPVPSPVLRDAALVPRDAPIACSSDRDCPALPAGSTCAFTCGPSVCQLVAVSTKLGAGPCFGNQRDGDPAIAIQRDSQLIIACDVDAGLYCERSTRRCAVSKARGAACEADVECGADGRCDDSSRTCVEAEPQGASCVTRHCGRGLFCTDHDRCERRRPAGGPCVLSEECASHACDHERCVAAAPPFACALALPAW